jgi:small conductance mechanosensitive channel
MPNSQDTLQDTLNNSVSPVVKVLEHPDQLLNAGFWLEAKDFLIQFGINLGTAILILLVGFWIAKQVRLGLTRLFQKKDIEPSLQTFLRSLISILIKVMVIITALYQLGIEMTSFVALLGAAGLAIGMAFSGTLSNFAGGVIILLFKPYRVGDFIQTQGETGIVKEILIFNTIMNTTDNKRIILPNGAIANGNITNFTMEKMRRVDFSYGIAYGDDFKVARDTLMRFIKEDDRILNEPEPFVALGSLGDSSVNITVRVWTSTENYWPVFFAMNERVYTEFSEHGLHIPFPQMDVHLKQ